MTRTAFTLLVLAGLLNVSCDNGKPTDKDGASDDTSDSNGTTTGEGDEDNDGYTPSQGDCDDSNPDVNPGAAEICDGKDNDCDGEIDEDGETEYYADADGDGFGDPTNSTMACDPPDGYVAVADDCDDSDASVYLGAPELCDGVDNDCDGDIDEDLATTYYADTDGDGYGDEANSLASCSGPPSGYVDNSGDCNDGEPLAYTGATEVCDGVDNDCNGTVDDGLTSTWYRDRDGDGYGDDRTSVEACSSPGREWISVGGDCDDGEPLAYTGALEYCDGVDNDCNGAIDDNAVDATEQIADNDGDGFGSPTDTTLACSALVDNTLDCDDGNANEPQVVDATASSSGADGSLAHPWTMIGDGILGATECVAVYPGTYSENIDFGGKDIHVFSTDGWASTTIDGSGSGSVVTFDSGETAGAELEGFTITGGAGTLESTSVPTDCGSLSTCTITYNRYYGGGIIVDGADPSLHDLLVWGNDLPAYGYSSTGSDETYTYSYGGGIFFNDTTLTAYNLVIEGNFADNGGGAYGSSSASVGMTTSRFLWNLASTGGGYTNSGGTFDLTNAILAANDATSAGGGAWVDGGSSTWWNVTAVGNDAPTGGGVSVTGGGAFYLYSSSVTGAATGDGVYVEAGSSGTADYSNVYGNAGGDTVSGSNNISADPMFVSWTNNDTDDDDLNLSSGSSLIDAGNPSAAYNDADGSRNDIGAYGGPGGGW